MPNSTGQYSMSPERARKFQHQGSTVEAGQNQSKGMATIQKKCWSRSGFMWVKMNVWIPLFYTTAFYISNEKKENIYNYIVFHHYLYNYLHWNSVFFYGFELLSGVPTFLPERTSFKGRPASHGFCFCCCFLFKSGDVFISLSFF